MLGSAVNVVLAAVAVGLLILVHEIGHFLAAKAVGVRVEVFSFGFLSKLIGFQKGETEYRLSLIPFGGYVKLAGMAPSEATGAPDEFVSKTPGQRAVILVAGVGTNVLLGLAGFIVAFTIGVPFPVAEVGSLEQGWPAWKAGLREGDVMVRINGVSDPDFQDVQREVALLGLDKVSVTVRRDGQLLDFEMDLRYDPRPGIKRLGFRPPFEPVVTGLFEVDDDGSCPAKQVGIRVGDRIVEVNGKPLSRLQEFVEVLQDHLTDPMDLVVERAGRRLPFRVRPVPVPDYWIGISGVTAAIQSLQGDGPAQRMDMLPGDRIAAVNNTRVRSIVEVENLIRGVYGEVEFLLERADERLPVRGTIGDEQALAEFLFSVECIRSNELTWVRPGSPAWEAEMRPGDRVIEVAGQTVNTWEEIQVAGASADHDPRLMRWMRQGKKFGAEVTPVLMGGDRAGSIGCMFHRPERLVRRLGVLSAVRLGAYKTYGVVADIVLALRGFVRRDISPRNLGSVVVIAYSSYLAAQEGLGRLLYLTAMFSVALAFVNILPVPVLDGGHLLFVAIEKLRGKPVAEKVMMVSQFIGLGLLIMLLVYVVRNDILRLIG